MVCGGTARGQDVCHLLLVEDHADTAAVLARMLRRAGFLVTLAESVAQALRLTEAAQREHGDHGRPNPIQLVVSDLGLPDGTGYELMQQLAARHQLTGVALSGFGMEEDVRLAIEAGFSRHLTKPVKFDVLLGAIRELLGARNIER